MGRGDALHKKWPTTCVNGGTRFRLDDVFPHRTEQKLQQLIQFVVGNVILKKNVSLTDSKIKFVCGWLQAVLVD